MNLVFIGFKKSGKTTIGKEVSSLLNKPFIDVDDLTSSHIALSSDFKKLNSFTSLSTVIPSS